MKPWYIRYATSHPVSFVITGHEDGRPYLYRWHLIPRNPFFNIYLHHFVGDDARTLHDHPWVSLAYQLSGGLYEEFEKNGEKWCRWIKKGKWTYRRSTFLHRLELLFKKPRDPVWTIFITGPKIRDWGFQTTGGWVDHLSFLNIKKGETYNG